MKKYLKLSLVLMTLVMLIGLSGCIEIIEGSSIAEGELWVHFIDVGQGEAMLIQEKGIETTYNMLIDAGNNPDGEYLVGYLKSLGIDTLDYIIGTHPHADHIGGMDDIIKNFNISTVLMPKVTTNTITFEEVMEALMAKGLRITTPVPGDIYNLGDAEFTILAPNSEDYSNFNNYSIVNRLVFGENSFIFTGDAEAISEKEILDKFSKGKLKSDVLKLGHHGSTTSTIDEFFEAVNPKYGVISCGLDNSYGHPHREMIKKLNDNSIDIYRTDEHGTIIMISDGKDIRIKDHIDLDIHKDNTNKKSNNIIITELDKIAEYIRIDNIGDQDMDISGWKILSVRGNQEFVFPSYILKAKSRVLVGGYDARDKVDHIWEIGGGVWSNRESDPAHLYDSFGNLISTFED